MSLTCTKCSKHPNSPLWCKDCEEIYCPPCANEHPEHRQEFRFMCQECEQPPENPKTMFCKDCEQHLCEKCCEKIHNKAKRAKHIRAPTSNLTLEIKTVYIACEDILEYYGFVNYGSMIMEISDLAPSNTLSLVILKKQKGKEIGSCASRSNIIIEQLNAERQFNEEYYVALKSHYPNIATIVFIETEKSFKYFEIAKKGKEFKIDMIQLGEAVKKPQTLVHMSTSSVSIPNRSFKKKNNISAKYPESRNHVSINNSTATENSLRKRKNKAPILYFHPFVTPKGDKRSHIEDHYRELAANGILMVKRKECDNFDDIVLRSFMRNIGEQEVEYVSLAIDAISVECLYWVVRSIQEDLIAPTEKLIVSRLKQSFNIKVNSKLWHYIVTYLSSNQYENDRYEIDRVSEIPKLIVKFFNHEDKEILYCRPDDKTPVKWVYEDLGTLDETETAWQQFIELIDDYFSKNAQIGGGRYGCVQFIKFNASSPLKDCSLGKLSMFVQEAINKGIIRYHKTLLVSNQDRSCSQQSEIQQEGHRQMTELQKKIKVHTLQLLLIDNFMEYGPGVPLSLAQIPQNLRKNCPFNINYIELGFAKLKNLLYTLAEFINIELKKSSIIYSHKEESLHLIAQRRKEVCMNREKLLKFILDELLEIISSSHISGIALEELQNQFTARTGLQLDCSLFNVHDFYNFLLYYGQNYFDVQINMGCYIVYQKCVDRTRKTSATSTPTFKEDYLDPIKLVSYNWDTSFPVESPSTKVDNKDEEDESESFSDYKSIYNLIDDEDSESKSRPKTVIVKEGSFCTGKNQMFVDTKVEESFELYSGTQFDDVNKSQEDPSITKNNKAHTRMYSNNNQQRVQHFRVYSNISQD